jgi:hypothetical protein
MITKLTPEFIQYMAENLEANCNLEIKAYLIHEGKRVLIYDGSMKPNPARDKKHPKHK